MSVEIIKILQAAGTTAVAQIKANMSSTGTNATGKSSKSLSYEVIEDGTKIILRVLGKPYFAVVETGRKPTPQYSKPSKAFVASIKEWVLAKGMPEGAAYAIAKSIHQKGTKLFRSGGRQDIYTSVQKPLVEQVAKDILQKYANLFLVESANVFKRNVTNSN